MTAYETMKPVSWPAIANRSMPPELPGFSIEMKPGTLATYAHGAEKVAAA